MTPDDLCSEWPVKSLEDVVDILDRHRVPVNAKERAKRPGDVPYYGAAGQVGTIDDHIFDEPLVLLGEDGIQFTDPGATKAYLVDGPSWVNNHAHVLRAAAGLDRRFLMHWLNTCDYRGLVNGTTRLKLTQKSMRGMPVPIPPVSEQRSVVELLERMLSLIDAATSSAARAGRRTRTLASAFLNSAVDGTLIGIAPYSGAPWRIPATWTWLTVADVASIRGGIQKKPDRKPRKNTAPFLRVANVQRNALDLADVHQVELFDGELARYRLEAGDLLVVEGNGSLAHIGRSAIWDDSIRDCVHQNHLIRVRPGETIRPEWLNMVWNSPRGSAIVREAARTTSGLYTLSTRKVAAVPIPVPPMEDQDAILEELRRREVATGHAEREATSSIERGPALRRAVLAAAFSGRLSGTSAQAPLADDVEEVLE